MQYLAREMGTVRYGFKELVAKSSSRCRVAARDCAQRFLVHVAPLGRLALLVRRRG
jgi:hypothetical protein